MNVLKGVKTKLLTALSVVAVAALAGCAAEGDYGVAYYGSPYGDYVYYDGFYGPYDGGYWGDDGFFYYEDGHGGYDRDEGHHFHHHAFGHSQHFHADRDRGHSG
jgi:hypothetical protein